MREARILDAIMALDVDRYSRLMGEDEAGTARAVREHRGAAVRGGPRRLDRQDDGRRVAPGISLRRRRRGTPIAIQGLMVERNAETPDGKKIVYRIGVNLDDVLIDHRSTAA
jgi:adenylate cyclase